jgi:predicted transcriptional regulator of viral defense system
MSTLVKSKSAVPLKVQDRIREQRITLFTPDEFRRLFGMASEQTKYFLESYTKRDMFVRLKKGLYALKGAMPREEVIANALYRPSYLSLEYALSRHGIIPETPYTVTSVTTKSTATFTVKGKVFSYTKIKRSAFTGYAPEKRGDDTVFFAEPEKALADYLYLVSLGKKTVNDRMDTSRLDKKKIKMYASLFHRKGLTRIVDELIY